jgi:hypothetical protein
MIRRISIALVVVGVGLLFIRHDAELPTLPFPAMGLLVKSPMTLSSAGDYYIRVTMPKVGDSLTLSEETVPCSLAITVTEPGKSPQTKEITSLTRYSEFGFGRTQDYRGGDAFRLGRGECDIEVTSQAACEAATARGAMISLEQDVGNPTDYYLRSLLRRYFAIGALCVGLLGIIVCEFRKKPNQLPKPTSRLAPGRGSS